MDEKDGGHQEEGGSEAALGQDGTGFWKMYRVLLHNCCWIKKE
jgi:hypothetical protein